MAAFRFVMVLSVYVFAFTAYRFLLDLWVVLFQGLSLRVSEALREPGFWFSLCLVAFCWLSPQVWLLVARWFDRLDRFIQLLSGYLGLAPLADVWYNPLQEV